MQCSAVQGKGRQGKGSQHRYARTHARTCPCWVPVEPYMTAGTPTCVEEPVPTKVMAPVMDCVALRCIARREKENEWVRMIKCTDKRTERMKWRQTGRACM